MIFYFTGTGNSLYAAQKISEATGERLISIATELNNNNTFEYILAENEKIGFVYPIYAWAPPKIVLKFIKKVKFLNYNNNYSFSLFTYGQSVGNASDVIKKAVNKRGINLNSVFSIQMPDNYIVMFDAEPLEEQEKKLQAASKSLEDINEIIKNKQNIIFNMNKGSFPAISTRVVSPIFNRFMVSSKKFFADDNCISCGLCERLCSLNNITVDKKPVWGKNCVHCMACINSCPVKAIQYGPNTCKRGRYTNPYVEL